jgi:thiol:disulfide interchange protein DsbD
MKAFFLRFSRGVGFAVFALLLTTGQVRAADPANEVDPFSDANRAERFPGPKPVRKPDATESRLRFEVTVEPKEAKPGQTVRVTIKGVLKPGFHTYPLTQRAPQQEELQLSTLSWNANAAIQPLWPITESAPEFVKDGDDILLEHKKPFTWAQDLLILPGAAPGATTLTGEVNLQVCDTTCVRGRQYLEVQLTVLPGTVPVSAELEKRKSEPAPAIKVVPIPAGFDGAPDDSSGGEETSGLLAFVLQGIFWGAVSLITPCVFPMIPITVSFFLKQAENKEHRALTMATVYSLTIVIVLTIAAVALLSFFRWLSVNPIMNIGLGALFIFFALSLFGMYEIELPSGLAQFTSQREGKGGLVGTIFMALTFTIISFACVAPFLGGFGGTAATSNTTLLHRILGGLAFSITFASPFFVLALFPNLMKKMPASGSWLNSVKVVMGFLELAAALKFLRAGELVLLPSPVLFTYDFVMGLYVALSILCGLYLLNVYRLPHDTPVEHLGVPRLLMSLMFLGLGFYLMPSLFHLTNKDGEEQRPRGAIFAWIDSFLLPDGSSDLPWTGNLDKGLQEARDKGQLVFIDFTGETCTNCKINEKNVFSKKEVKSLLKRYELVQLYTDKVPDKLYSGDELSSLDGGTKKQRADADRNLAFQREKFDTEQLPLYVIVKPTPDGSYKVVAKYAEGKINNETAFLNFLRKPLNAKP